MGGGAASHALGDVVAAAFINSDRKESTLSSLSRIAAKSIADFTSPFGATNSSKLYVSTLVIRMGKLLRHQTPNKLLDRVIKARRRPHSQKSDRGDR